MTAHALWSERYTGTDSSETRVNTAEGGRCECDKPGLVSGRLECRPVSGGLECRPCLVGLESLECRPVFDREARRVYSRDRAAPALPERRGGRGRTRAGDRRGTASRRYRKSAPVGQKVERKRSEIINRALSRLDPEPARGDQLWPSGGDLWPSGGDLQTSGSDLWWLPVKVA